MKPQPLQFYNPDWTTTEKLERLRALHPEAARGFDLLVTEILKAAWRDEFGPDWKGRGRNVNPPEGGLAE